MKKLGAAAAVGAAIVTLHGITNKKWQDWHTIFTVMGAVVAVATLSK